MLSGTRHQRSSYVGRSLMSVDALLAQRFLAMLGSSPAGNDPFQVIGPLLRSLVPRIGSNKLIDLAASYAIDSHIAFRRPGEAETNLAQVSGARAMRLLRANLLPDRIEEVRDVRVAIRLLHMAEVGRYFSVVVMEARCSHSFGDRSQLFSFTTTHRDLFRALYPMVVSHSDCGLRNS